MNTCIYYILAIFLLVSACDKKPDVEYHPPVLTGTAYVLAADADHIAVVDLQSQDLDRVVIGRKGVDLAASQADEQLGVFILSGDGSLAFLPEVHVQSGEDDASLEQIEEGQTEQKIDIQWTKVLDKGVALASGGKGTLWLLGGNELVHISQESKVLSRHPLSEQFSSIIFDGEHSRIWLLSREKAIAVSFDLTTQKMGKTIQYLGNSIHQGLAFPGRSELWIAEGNEYMDGKPYGVGFAKNGPAMAGGFNLFSSDNGTQHDFVMVGGNVVDLVLGPKAEKVYAAVNRLPYYNEATLSVLGSESKRTEAQLRLCLACHEIQGVEVKSGQSEVRAIALLWSKGLTDEHSNRRTDE